MFQEGNENLKVFVDFSNVETICDLSKSIFNGMMLYGIQTQMEGKKRRPEEVGFERKAHELEVVGQKDAIRDVPHSPNMCHFNANLDWLSLHTEGMAGLPCWL